MTVRGDGGNAVGRAGFITVALLLTLAAPGAPRAVAQAPPAPLPPTLQQSDPLATPPPGRVVGGRSVIASSGPGAAPTKPVVPIPDDGLYQPRPTMPLRHAAASTGPTQPGNPVVVGTTSRSPGSAAAAAVRPAATVEPAPAAAPPVPAVATVAPSAGAQTASVSLEKVGPAAFNVGKPFVYEVVVRNTGTAPVHQVRVQDELPAGARMLSVEPQAEVQGERLSWGLGTLEAGAERRLRVHVQPAGEGEVQANATATFTTACALRTRITRPQIAVTKSGPESALVGDTVTFQIVVSNPGTGPATNVLIHDRLPSGLQHPQGSEIEAEIGTLGAGETRTLTLTTTAVKSGRQVNEVRVTADDNLQASAQAAVAVTGAALLLRKNGPQQSFLQRELEHTLEVVNSGDALATNVKLFDTLPAGLEFVSASDGGVYDKTTRRCDWTIGTLPPGQSRTVTIKMMAVKPGEWVNQALAQGDRGLEAKAGNPVQVEGVPALMLEVVDLDDPVEVGHETVYEIRVVNQGNAACLNVRIVATVPEGLTPLGGEGPAPYRIQGQQVAFDPVAKLAGRADAVFKVKVKGARSGDWRFKVNLTCDQLGRPVYEEESTRVYNDAVKDGPIGTPPAPPPQAQSNWTPRPFQATWVGRPVRAPTAPPVPRHDERLVGGREYVVR